MAALPTVVVVSPPPPPPPLPPPPTLLGPAKSRSSDSSSSKTDELDVGAGGLVEEEAAHLVAQSGIPAAIDPLGEVEKKEEGAVAATADLAAGGEPERKAEARNAEGVVGP